MAEGTTELSAWSERLLYGTTLGDKLADPGRLTDAHPGVARPIPDAPGRPPGLELHTRRSRRPLPGPGRLAEPDAACEVLHAFANHELLALELMALVLLRFPDADPAFRRTLASTIRDEQRHLGLYLDRVRALGGEVGEAPVSAFFWTCLRDVPDPAAFVAGMSLVLEQANLDFSRAWRDAFLSAQDHQTVDILDQVYRDEIRHVRHGVRWLRAWSPPEVDEWTAWTTRLRLPLTARRARGPVFDREGRQRAGLSPETIERVRVAGHSKGRPPIVYSFTPWVESEHAAPGFTPSHALRALQADLAPTLLLLASEDDVVVVPRAPEPRLLSRLAEVGIRLPQVVVASEPGRIDLGEIPLAGVQPWGWSKTSWQRWHHLRAQSQEATGWHPDTARLARKDVAAGVLSELLDLDPRLDGPRPRVETTLDGVLQAVQALGEVVIKAPWSAAGRDRVRPRGGLTAAERGWLQRILRAQGAVVVDPWCERVLDLSLQGHVSDEGLTVHGMTLFHTDARGGFRGVRLGAWHRSLPTPLIRFLQDDGRDAHWVPRALERALRLCLAAAPGHRGPVGLDAFVHRIDGALRLRPVVEINPRLTFGRVGQRLGRLVASGVTADWWHLGRRDLAALDAPDFATLARRWQDQAPAEGSPLRSGVLPTTSAETAEHVWTVLLVGPARDLMPTLTAESAGGTPPSGSATEPAPSARRATDPG